MIKRILHKLFGKKETGPVHCIVQVEWTMHDAIFMKRVFQNPTWEKLVAGLHQDLFNSIVYDGATDEYRKGYLQCIRDTQRFQPQGGSRTLFDADDQAGTLEPIPDQEIIFQSEE